jgi:hypothetical protein
MVGFTTRAYEQAADTLYLPGADVVLVTLASKFRKGTVTTASRRGTPPQVTHVLPETEPADAAQVRTPPAGRGLTVTTGLAGLSLDAARGILQWMLGADRCGGDRERGAQLRTACHLRLQAV